MIPGPQVHAQKDPLRTRRGFPSLGRFLLFAPQPFLVGCLTTMLPMNPMGKLRPGKAEGELGFAS